MRADERQAAVAYTYAWWLTGDDDAAAIALREALQAPDPPDDGDESRLAALVGGVRAHLGDLRPMCPASELALLHDGLGVGLDDAAPLARVSPDDIAVELAHGRLEALLETVREDFDHPQRLGGLAVATPADIAHARQCPSCARLRTLLERGRSELRDVVSVSAPAGLLARLIAEAPVTETPVVEVDPPPAVVEDEPPAVVEDEPPAVVEDEPAAPVVEDEPPAAVVEDEPPVVVVDEPLLVDDETVDLDDDTAVDLDDAVFNEPWDDRDDGGDLLVVPPSTEAPPEPDTETLQPVTPARRRAQMALAVAGTVTACALVYVIVASGGVEELPLPGDDPGVTTNETAAPEPTQPPVGPQASARKSFAVTEVGLLLSGDEVMAPLGTVVEPGEPLRIAVGYENATKGIELKALWRVGDETFQRLDAIVSARRSRHVWGIPVPSDGWPGGDHRIVITADDTVEAALEFTVASEQ